MCILMFKNEKVIDLKKRDGQYHVYNAELLPEELKEPLSWTDKDMKVDVSEFGIDPRIGHIQDYVENLVPDGAIDKKYALYSEFVEYLVLNPNKDGYWIMEG